MTHGHAGPWQLTARIGKDRPGSDSSGASTPVTVRGRQGVYVTATSTSGEVWAELPDGLWLEVFGRAPKEDPVEVADTMKINLDVKYPWIGRH